MDYQYKTISADAKLKEEICERIKRLLEKNNYTQLQLAQTMGVSKSTVSKWVNGESLTLDALYNLSLFFGCTVDYLIAGRDYAVAGAIGKRPGDNSFESDDIDEDVKTFYRIIKGEELNGISLAGALNYLIADDLTFETRGRINLIDSRFIDAWANYLSIDSSLDQHAYFEDIGVKQKIPMSYSTLESAILVRILSLLEEKKLRFQNTKKFKKLHDENINRRKIVDAEEELWQFNGGKGEYGGKWADESYSKEEIEKKMKEYEEIADINNPLPYKETDTY